jgi:hypothetical protein
MSKSTSQSSVIHVGEPYNPWRLFHGLFVQTWLARRPVKEISPGAKLVFGRLCQYAGRDGQAWPSHADLAAELGYSPRQARRLVTELVSLGLIRRIGRTRVNGSTKSNGYEFIGHQWMMELDTEDMLESGNPADNRPHLTTPAGSDVARPPRSNPATLEEIHVEEIQERESLSSGYREEPKQTPGSQIKGDPLPTPGNPIERWLSRYGSLTTRCPLPRNAAKARESRMRVEDFVKVYGEERAVALLEEVCAERRPVSVNQAVLFCEKKAEASESTAPGIAPGARRALEEYISPWEKPCR